MDRENNNTVKDKDKLSYAVYNDRTFAESYSNKIEYNSHNALYERPAVRSLLGDIAGMKILDAGCGPGVLSSELIDNGAVLTSVDFSPEMIRLTKERTDNRARVLELNLNKPMEMLEDEEFDIIVSSLTIHYLNDLTLFFSECNRVLKKDGIMVFSTHHPFMDFSFHSDGNYFETELVKDEWPSYNISMEFYRRPLSELFNIVRQAEFTVDEILEPLPSEKCKEKFPDAFDVLSKKPWFIIFKLRKLTEE